MKKAAFGGLFLAILGLGLALRLARLEARPIHHDEANQAVKFGALLEKGEYRYDPADHHGPTLYYLTLPAAWMRGQKTLGELDEKTLRLVPVVFGIGLLLLLLLLKRELGPEVVILGALFAALSPALTYYSRFYIQESLFVFFAWGFLISLGKSICRPGPGWAAAAGISAGLLFATKETAVIVFAAAAMGIAAAITGAGKFHRIDGPAAGRRGIKPAPILMALVAAAVVAGLFFSSFGKHPGGIVDSLAAIKDYAARSSDAGVHAQPWYYYLQTLVGTKSEGTIWSEALILGLALIGIVAAFGQKRPAPEGVDKNGIRGTSEAGFWPLYLTSATLIMTAAYSILAYKTPWNLIVFQAGFAILAGFGASVLLKAIRPTAGRAVVLLLILLGAAQLGRQNLLANGRYAADPRNPYAYSQTSPDFLRLVERVRALAAIHRDGRGMLIKVIAEADQQWPLPWYLRSFGRVGYWTSVAAAGDIDAVPIVIASRHNADVIERTAGEAFQVEYYGLRPGVLLTVFIDRDLWTNFLRKQEDR
jgi:uncharacterized protein (TIGR03663 family)